MTDDGTGTPLSRRAFLGTAALGTVVVGGAAAGGIKLASAGQDSADVDEPDPVPPRGFRGYHQIGVLEHPRPHGLLAAFTCVDGRPAGAGRDVPRAVRGDRRAAVRPGAAGDRPGAAAAGQRRAAGGDRPRPDGHGLGRRLPVRRPVRAGRPQAAGAGHDAVPGQRPARPGALARRRAGRAAGQGAGRLRARAAPGDAPDPVRAGAQVDAGHVHPARRDPEARPDPEPQPARLQGRHGQPGRGRRGADEHPGLDVDRGHRADRDGPRAGLDRRRDLPGGPDHPDDGRALGPGLAGRAGGDLRPAQGVRRAAVRAGTRPTSRTTPTTPTARSSR